MFGWLMRFVSGGRTKTVDMTPEPVFRPREVAARPVVRPAPPPGRLVKESFASRSSRVDVDISKPSFEDSTAPAVFYASPSPSPAPCPAPSPSYSSYSCSSRSDSSYSSDSGSSSSSDSGGGGGGGD